MSRSKNNQKTQTEVKAPAPAPEATENATNTAAAPEVKNDVVQEQAASTATDSTTVVKQGEKVTEQASTETETKAEETTNKPPVEEVSAPAPTETPKIDVSPKAVTKAQSENAVAIYIERTKESGTFGEQMVISTMEEYLSVMNSSAPVTTEQIVREQGRLYTMFKNIGRRNEDFRKCVVATRIFFREYKDTAFHDTRINRGHEALQFSADDRRAFYTYLQLFKIIASVNDLKDIKKSVDVSRSLTNPVIPAEVKERYVGLIS